MIFLVILFCSECLGNKNTNTTSGLDFFFSLSGEESGLDDDWLSWESSLTEDLEESTFGDVNDWSDGGILSSIDSGFFGDERPDLVNVDGAKIKNKNWF